MKWTIQELTRLEHQDNTFSDTLDLSEKIKGTDILKISQVEVDGDYEIFEATEFIFYIDIRCTLTLACAITLKEVQVELDLSVEETFSAVKNDNFHIIEGITIDLLPIIWSNIILEKPMRVVSENAYDNFELNNVEFDTEPSNKGFADLKKYKQ